MKKKRQNSSPTESKTPQPTPPESKNKFPSKIIFGAVALLIVGGLAFYFLYSKNSPKRTNRPVGAVLNCQQIPAFVKTRGFGGQAALSTSDRFLPGLVLIDKERKYQNPTWKAAGSLAPITRDGKGNAYAAPAPMIDVLKNKPDEQNRVYKIDGQTEEMKIFADLPKASATTPENPYGVLGLSFDCETNDVYASTVFGSTRDKQAGAIFQISQSEGKVLSQLDKTDAFGLAVFNSAKGKRLYYGLARTPEIWSVDLTDDGKFTGAPRREISLENLGTRGDDKARRINFSPQNEMIVFGVEFNFNLIAPTEKQETVYRFRYDAAKDAWNYIAEPPQIVGEN